MENDLLKNLNPEQHKAVVHENGPLLILAGAGTGKTMAITRRIAYLVSEKKAKTDEILALTFTDKSAGEMEERVDKLLPYGYTDLWISTFHSFCERILKEHALDIGLPGDFELLSQTGQWLLVRQNLDKFELDYYKPLGNPTKFIHALLTHFSRAKDEVIEPMEYLEYAKSLGLDKDTAEHNLLEDEIKRLKEVAGAYHTYQQILLENNALDFGDLINYTLKLFRERPQILDLYRKKFKYILVDEFQDTNYAQYELIKLLAAPKNNLTVVGDDDQSIYKFRGASISNILQFKEDFPTCEEILLIKNYRSGQNILDLSYKFIQQNNPNRLEVKLGDNLSKQLESQIEDSGQAEHLNFDTLQNEAEGVAEKIIELKGNSGDTTWSDFAILVRANDSAKPFISVLNKKGVPYQFFALRGLYSKPIILDILAYFKAIYDYHDNPSFCRILDFPIWDIPPLEISKINYEVRRSAKSVFEVLKVADTLSLEPETQKIIQKILSFVEKHSSLAKEKLPSELLLTFLNDTEYHKFILGLPEQIKKENLSFLDQFYKRIKKSETDPNFRANEFLDEIDYELEAGDEGALSFDPDVGPDMVRIMTIHAAKGLEFDYVFIPNLVDKRFPTIKRGEKIPLPDALIKEILPEGDIHLEEERRLFYVAVTRAKKGIFLTSAEDYGGARKKKPSRFLIELDFVQQQAKKSTSKNDILSDLEQKPTIITPQSIEKYIPPSYFSFSALAAFNSCPLQYKYSHILKVHSFGKAVFSYGKTMHNTLQKFISENIRRKNMNQAALFDTKSSSGQGVSMEELLRYYEESWIDEWFENKKQKEDYRKLGKESLNKFFEKFEEEKPEPIDVEKGFYLKIGDCTLKGRIDRIDKVEGGIEIVDYKTGQSKGDKIPKDSKKQLLIYQMAAEQCMDIKPQKLTYYYLNDNKTQSFLGTEKEKQEIQQEIMADVEKIKNSDFAAAPKSGARTCVFCDFKNICNKKQD
ncbi:MAG: UvrD-helicase domain-containing protein [Parcubacteria group bacterium]|nr:UvrD-helicase domain-containing protein [Parcubacteria group bacterium]